MPRTRQNKGGCKIGDKGGNKGCKVGKKAPRNETILDHRTNQTKTDSDKSKTYKPKGKVKVKKLPGVRKKKESKDIGDGSRYFPDGRIEGKKGMSTARYKRYMKEKGTHTMKDGVKHTGKTHTMKSKPIPAKKKKKLKSTY